MTHYVCIENNLIISTLNYEPNVPATVEVHEISDEQHKLITDGSHHFNVTTKKVELIVGEVADARAAEKEKIATLAFLANTDWKILRHIREKALGITTSMSEEDYIQLELQRNSRAKSINN
jgi:diaminopimelate decarboxylase